MNDLERQLSIGHQQPTAVAPMATSVPAQASRSQENLLSIHAELDTPAEPRLARWLRRIGVPDLTIPLVTATPALRRSWFGAVAIAVLFALTTASNDTGVGVDRIVVFLTLAPLVPLLGVALAFGKGVDPTHDLVVAAPRDTFNVFLIRTVTVLVASSAILLLTSLLLPDGGIFRIAWLLPSLASSALSLALSARFAPRRIALTLAAAWLLIVVVVSSAASAAVMFGPVTQVLAICIVAASAMFVLGQREQFEVGA